MKHPFEKEFPLLADWSWNLLAQGAWGLLKCFQEWKAIEDKKIIASFSHLVKGSWSRPFLLSQLYWAILHTMKYMHIWIWEATTTKKMQNLLIIPKVPLTSFLAQLPPLITYGLQITMDPHCLYMHALAPPALELQVTEHTQCVVMCKHCVLKFMHVVYILNFNHFATALYSIGCILNFCQWWTFGSFPQFGAILTKDN